MLILKAEYLQLGQIAKPTVMYAGKLFCKVQDFELSQRSKAEEECRENWKDGKPSLLVECGSRWILYSEGVIPELTPLESAEMVLTPSDEVLSTPSFDAPVEPLPSKVALNSSAGHEIRYRGSLIRKPIESIAQESTPVESVKVQPSPSDIPARREQRLTSQEGEEKGYIEMRYRGNLIRKPV